MRRATFALALATAACGAPHLTAPPSTGPPALATTPSPVASPIRPTAEPAALTLAATGLGPCDEPWWKTCNYAIRVEGPGGYDHRGSFAWDEGPRGQDYAHGKAGPVASTGVLGDVPATLAPGTWTLSFRLYHGSDVATYAPVPGGTPRLAEEDPFTAACTVTVQTAGVVEVNLRVAFKGAKCFVATEQPFHSPRR